MASPSARRRLADLGVRLLYVAAAIALLWVMAIRLRSVRDLYAASFEFPQGRWFLYVGAGVLAGVMLGLAARPFMVGSHGYRWDAALTLALPPAIILLLGLAIFEFGWSVPSWLLTILETGQSVLAIMVGVGITAGLTSRAAPGPD